MDGMSNEIDPQAMKITTEDRATLSFMPTDSLEQWDKRENMIFSSKTRSAEINQMDFGRCIPKGPN